MAACDSLFGPGEWRVVIEPAEIELLIGDTLWVEATVRSPRGRRVRDANVRWSAGPHGFGITRGVIVQPGGFGEGAGRARVMGSAIGTTPVIAEFEGHADTVHAVVRGHDVSFVSVAAGGLTCGLTAAGEAFCWGMQYVGTFTNGVHTFPFWAPRPVPGGIKFAAMDTGLLACGLTPEGAPYCWESMQARPVLVSEEHRFASLVMGHAHACGLTKVGDAYCWGYDLVGQLGVGDPVEYCEFGPCSTVPAPVTGDLRFTSLAAGGSQTCGVTTDGASYCWGNNDQNQLGNPDAQDVCATAIQDLHCSRVPVPVVGAPEFKKFALGAFHSCGLTPTGEAYCWGGNGRGQLGTGVPEDTSHPVPVTGSLTFTDITSGGWHVCGLTPEGEAHCWGSGTATGFDPGDECWDFGTLFQCNPVPVPVVGRLSFTSIRSGNSYTCATALSGGVYCWGNNGSGQLGIGDATIESSFVPQRVYGTR